MFSRLRLAYNALTSEFVVGLFVKDGVTQVGVFGSAGSVDVMTSSVALAQHSKRLQNDYMDMLVDIGCADVIPAFNDEWSRAINRGMIKPEAPTLELINPKKMLKIRGSLSRKVKALEKNER